MPSLPKNMAPRRIHTDIRQMTSVEGDEYPVIVQLSGVPTAPSVSAVTHDLPRSREAVSSANEHGSLVTTVPAVAQE